MEIEVWSVGKAKFTADPEYQEPMIREAVDQRGDVASVILDYTDNERSDISYDEYARVTGDLPGLVLFEGWLTGDRNAPPPGNAAAQVPAPGVEITRMAAANTIRGLRELLGEILSDLKARDVGRRVLGQMPNGWSADEYQVSLWAERAEKAGVELP